MTNSRRVRLQVQARLQILLRSSGNTMVMSFQAHLQVAAAAPARISSTQRLTTTGYTSPSTTGQSPAAAMGATQAHHELSISSTSPLSVVDRATTSSSVPTTTVMDEDVTFFASSTSTATGTPEATRGHQRRQQFCVNFGTKQDGAANRKHAFGSSTQTHYRELSSASSSSSSSSGTSAEQQEHHADGSSSTLSGAAAVLKEAARQREAAPRSLHQLQERRATRLTMGRKTSRETTTTKIWTKMREAALPQFQRRLSHRLQAPPPRRQRPHIWSSTTPALLLQLRNQARWSRKRQAPPLVHRRKRFIASFRVRLQVQARLQPLPRSSRSTMLMSCQVHFQAVAAVLKEATAAGSNSSTQGLISAGYTGPSTTPTSTTWTATATGTSHLKHEDGSSAISTAAVSEGSTTTMQPASSMGLTGAPMPLPTGTGAIGTAGIASDGAGYASTSYVTEGASAQAAPSAPEQHGGGSPSTNAPPTTRTENESHGGLGDN